MLRIQAGNETCKRVMCEIQINCNRIWWIIRSNVFASSEVSKSITEKQKQCFSLPFSIMVTNDIFSSSLINLKTIPTLKSLIYVRWVITIANMLVKTIGLQFMVLLETSPQKCRYLCLILLPSCFWKQPRMPS